jgi:Dickkopf-like protein
MKRRYVAPFIVTVALAACGSSSKPARDGSAHDGATLEAGPTDAQAVEARDASSDGDAPAHLEAASIDADAPVDVDGSPPDTVASPDADPTTIEGFCAALEAAVVANQNRCSPYESIDLEGYLPVSECPHWVAGVHHGRMLFDPTRAVACLASYTFVDCVLTAGEVCGQVLTPQVADNGACDPLGISECAVGSFCKGVVDGCGGTCTPLRPQGGACSGNDECAGGQTCNFTTETCELYGAANAPCGGGNPQCDYADACVGGSVDGGTAGICQPLTLDGPCTPDGTGGGCIPGEARCPGPGASRCVAFQPIGGACTKNADCGVGWCTSAGTCAPLLEPIGAACGTLAGTDVGCVIGAYCNATTNLCQRLVPTGAACVSDLECEGGLGNSSQCDPTTHTCALVCPPL